MSRQKMWTAREMAEMKERYPHESNVDLAAEFGRTAHSIGQAARRIGVKKSKYFISEMLADHRSKRNLGAA